MSGMQKMNMYMKTKWQWKEKESYEMSSRLKSFTSSLIAPRDGSRNNAKHSRGKYGNFIFTM